MSQLNIDPADIPDDVFPKSGDSVLREPDPYTRQPPPLCLHCGQRVPTRGKQPAGDAALRKRSLTVIKALAEIVDKSTLDIYLRTELKSVCAALSARPKQVAEQKKGDSK